MNAGSTFVDRDTGNSAQVNDKLSSSIVIAELTSQSIEIPFTRIVGKQRTPMLTVSAGVHGSEYVGILTAHKLANELAPSNLEGALTVLPLVNRLAFENFVKQVNPIDGVNINRIFPGKQDGSISYQMAYNLFNQIILKSNFYVDLHGGEPGEFLTPFILYCETGKSNVDEKTEDLVETFGIKYVWKMKSAEALGTLSKEVTLTPDGMAAAEAAKKGIPSFIAESGTDGKIDENYVQILYKGLMNVMKKTGVMKGTLETVNEKPIFSDRHSLVNASQTGIKYIEVNAGDVVDEGQKLCETRSLSGTVKETITSPIHGVVLSVRNNPISRPSENIFLILGLN
jgi:predicted deacylase